MQPGCAGSELLAALRERLRLAAFEVDDKMAFDASLRRRAEERNIVELRHFLCRLFSFPEVFDHI